MANHHPMQISEHTQSFKHLFRYALPYAIGYTLLPYVLGQFDFMLGGILLTIMVVIFLNISVINIFRKRQRRLLEKLECSRIALLSMTLTLIISLVVVALFFNEMGLPWLEMNDKGLYKIIAISGFVAFIINYAVVFYSLWWMQRFWKN